MLAAGSLDQRVTIQSRTDVIDAMGGVSSSWATLATVWAQVSPITGREFVSAEQTMSGATVRVRIRRRADVTPRMRLVHGSRIYDIQSVADVDSKGIVTEMIAEEIAGNER